MDTFKYKHNPEDAEALAADLIPTSMLVDLADANWKTRIAALDEMATWVDGVIDDLDAEVLIRSLAKKGWSEKNFQVWSHIDHVKHAASHLRFRSPPRYSAFAPHSLKDVRRSVGLV